MNDITVTARVKHHRNHAKTGTVVADLNPKAPVYGVVKVKWDDNEYESRHHKFTLRRLQYAWPTNN